MFKDDAAHKPVEGARTDAGSEWVSRAMENSHCVGAESCIARVMQVAVDVFVRVPHHNPPSKPFGAIACVRGLGSRGKDTPCVGLIDTQDATTTATTTDTSGTTTGTTTTATIGTAVISSVAVVVERTNTVWNG